MKDVAYWEALLTRAEGELQSLRVPAMVVSRLGLMKGKPKRLQQKFAVVVEKELRRRREAVRKQGQLERRVAYYRERIEALRSRTLWERLRAGGARL